MKKRSSEVIVTSMYRRESPGKRKPSFGPRGYKKQTNIIHEIFADMGIRFVRSPLTSWKNGLFHAGWERVDGVWKAMKPYAPQIVWNRMRFDPTYIPAMEEIMRYALLVGHPTFLMISNDKFITSKIFHEVSPVTSYVSDGRHLKNALAAIPTKRVVLKPNQGSAGRGVRVLPKSKIKPHMITEPMVVQEFIETAKGFRDIARGRFDLRVELINDKIFKAYIRMAPGDTFLSNVSKGGTMQWIPDKHIPGNVKKILKDMQRTLSSFYPMYYTVDFLIDAKGRAHLGEMNHAPGIKFPDGFQGSEEDSWKKLGGFFVDEYNQWKDAK